MFDFKSVSISIKTCSSDIVVAFFGGRRLEKKSNSNRALVGSWKVLFISKGYALQICLGLEEPNL